MITFNISCDVCRESMAFSLGTSKIKMHKALHYIKRKDICPICVTKAIIDKNYIPSGTESIDRDLTQTEKKKVIKYYGI